MEINPHDNRPIFIQIQEGLETAILAGVYPEESQIPSTTELSVNFHINPATALKGINGLVNENILYKKRGIGVFVKEGAPKMIREKRQKAFKESFVLPLIEEAKRLQIEAEQIIAWITESKEEGGKNNGKN